MSFAKIKGVGSFLPEKILTNKHLEKLVDTTDEWIVSRTGIKTRHIAQNNELTSELATKALNNALIDANISANELDAIILATTTPDNIFPATAIKVQHNIGLKTGFAFDVQAVCSGFLYALNIANLLIKHQGMTSVAVIGAETMSKIVNWKDRNTCVLFGDGAGAVILKNDDKPGIIDVTLHSDAEFMNALKVNNKTIEMNGPEVFKQAVSKMTDSCISLLENNNFSISDIDWLLLHQANHRIIKSVSEKLGIDPVKTMSTVDKHANTSAASIPLALDYYKRKHYLKKDELILMSAVGAGLTWGAALLKL